MSDAQTPNPHGAPPDSTQVPPLPGGPLGAGARPEGSDAPTSSSSAGPDVAASGAPPAGDGPAANPGDGSGDPDEVTDQSPPADLADTAIQTQSGTALGEGTVPAGQVPDGQTVTGFNTADGAPTIIDPGYVTPSPAQGTAQTRATAAALAADEDATEAERSSGERTVTSNPDGPDILDGAMISTNTGIRYRAKNTIRAVLLDRPFRADGRDGGDGDYLAEDEEGHRFVLTRDELDDAWVPLV